MKLTLMTFLLLMLLTVAVADKFDEDVNNLRENPGTSVTDHVYADILFRYTQCVPQKQPGVDCDSMVYNKWRPGTIIIQYKVYIPDTEVIESLSGGRVRCWQSIVFTDSILCEFKI